MYMQSQYQKRSLNAVLMDKNRLSRFLYGHSPKMIPEGVSPVCLKLKINVPEWEVSKKIAKSSSIGKYFRSATGKAVGYLNEGQKKYYKENYKIDKEEIKQLKRPQYRPISSLYRFEDDPSIEKVIDLGDYQPWHTTLQPCHHISHSRLSHHLVELTEFISLQETLGEASNNYELEMAPFIDQSYFGCYRSEEKASTSANVEIKVRKISKIKVRKISKLAQKTGRKRKKIFNKSLTRKIIAKKGINSFFIPIENHFNRSADTFHKLPKLEAEMNSSNSNNIDNQDEEILELLISGSAKKVCQQNVTHGDSTIKQSRQSKNVGAKLHIKRTSSYFKDVGNLFNAISVKNRQMISISSPPYIINESEDITNSAFNHLFYVKYIARDIHLQQERVAFQNFTSFFKEFLCETFHENEKFKDNINLCNNTPTRVIHEVNSHSNNSSKVTDTERVNKTSNDLNNYRDLKPTVENNFPITDFSKTSSILLTPPKVNEEIKIVSNIDRESIKDYSSPLVIGTMLPLVKRSSICTSTPIPDNAKKLFRMSSVNITPISLDCKIGNSKFFSSFKGHDNIDGNADGSKCFNNSNLNSVSEKCLNLMATKKVVERPAKFTEKHSLNCKDNILANFDSSDDELFSNIDLDKVVSDVPTSAAGINVPACEEVQSKVSTGWEDYIGKATGNLIKDRSKRSVSKEKAACEDIQNYCDNKIESSILSVTQVIDLINQPSLVAETFDGNTEKDSNVKIISPISDYKFMDYSNLKGKFVKNLSNEFSKQSYSKCTYNKLEKTEQSSMEHLNKSYYEHDNKLNEKCIPESSRNKLNEKCIPGSSSNKLNEKCFPGSSSNKLNETCTPGNSSNKLNEKYVPGSSINKFICDDIELTDGWIDCSKTKNKMKSRNESSRLPVIPKHSNCENEEAPVAHFHMGLDFSEEDWSNDSDKPTFEDNALIPKPMSNKDANVIIKDQSVKIDTKTEKNISHDRIENAFDILDEFSPIQKANVEVDSKPDSVLNIYSKKYLSFSLLSESETNETISKNYASESKSHHSLNSSTRNCSRSLSSKSNNKSLSTSEVNSKHSSHSDSLDKKVCCYTKKVETSINQSILDNDSPIVKRKKIWNGIDSDDDDSFLNKAPDKKFHHHSSRSNKQLITISDDDFETPYKKFADLAAEKKKKLKRKRIKDKNIKLARGLIQTEADVSSESSLVISSDESEFSLDEYDQSFVNDDVQPTQERRIDMQAVYLQSVRSPLKKKVEVGKSCKKDVEDILSQEDAYYSQVDESEDSFVVDNDFVEYDSEHLGDTMLANDSIINHAIMDKISSGNMKNFELKKEKVKKRKRIIILDGSSDEEKEPKKVKVTESDEEKAPNKVKITERDEEKSPKKVKVTESVDEKAPKKVKVTESDEEKAPKKVKVTESDEEKAPKKVKYTDSKEEKFLNNRKFYAGDKEKEVKFNDYESVLHNKSIKVTPVNCAELEVPKFDLLSDEDDDEWLDPSEFIPQSQRNKTNHLEKDLESVANTGANVEKSPIFNSRRSIDKSSNETPNYNKCALSNLASVPKTKNNSNILTLSSSTVIKKKSLTHHSSVPVSSTSEKSKNRSPECGASQISNSQSSFKTNSISSPFLSQAGPSETKSLSKLTTDSQSKVCILIDTCEVNIAGMVTSTLRLKHGAQTYLAQLTPASYVISNRMAVYRQTYTAFSSSANKVRLVGRIRSLLQSYDRPVIIIEMDSKTGTKLPPRTMYLDTISCACSQLPQLKILQTSNQEETAGVIWHLTCQEKVKGHSIPSFPTGNLHFEQAVKFYRTIPRITAASAIFLALNFPTVSSAMNSNEEELKSNGKLSSGQIKAFQDHLRRLFRKDMLSSSYTNQS